MKKKKKEKKQKTKQSKHNKNSKINNSKNLGVGNRMWRKENFDMSDDFASLILDYTSCSPVRIG